MCTFFQHPHPQDAKKARNVHFFSAFINRLSKNGREGKSAMCTFFQVTRNLIPLNKGARGTNAQCAVFFSLSVCSKWNIKAQYALFSSRRSLGRPRGWRNEQNWRHALFILSAPQAHLWN